MTLALLTIFPSHPHYPSPSTSLCASFLYNVLPILCGLIAENPHHSFLFHAHADPPTATLLVHQRSRHRLHPNVHRCNAPTGGVRPDIGEGV